jgi:hypothetical protein
MLAATSIAAKPVSGVVKDLQTNLPVANVVVKIFETGDSTFTDGAGVYFFPDVALGSYTFMVGRNSYVPKIMTSVSVSNSCCIGTTGNVNKSLAETPDLSDLSLMIAYLTVTPKPALPCLAEANINSSVATTPDLSDLSLLIAVLTVTPKPALPNCP